MLDGLTVTNPDNKDWQQLFRLETPDDKRACTAPIWLQVGDCWMVD